MIIRYNKDNTGIIEYLKTGKMQGREQQREDLDKRVHLLGDLDTTETIIKSIGKSKKWSDDNYLHITLSFSEEIYEKIGSKTGDESGSDELNFGILQKIAGEAKRFLTAGFRADDVNVYAEAHIPKLKSYKDKTTGELVRRYPHIHMIIPQVHLSFGNKLVRCEGGKKNKWEMIEASDAFQELINIKYGFTSPKVNRRMFNNRGEIIGRYKETKKLTKEDMKQLSQEEHFIKFFKQKIVEEQLYHIEYKAEVNNSIAKLINDKKIQSYDQLKNYLDKLVKKEDYLDLVEYKGIRFKDKIKLYMLAYESKFEISPKATFQMEFIYREYLKLRQKPFVFDDYMYQEAFWSDNNRQAIVGKYLENITTSFVNPGTEKEQNSESLFALKTEEEYRNILSAYYKKRGIQVRKRYHSNTPSFQRHQNLNDHIKDYGRRQLKTSLSKPQAAQLKEAVLREYDQLSSLYKDMKLLNASSQKLWDNAQKLRHVLYGGSYISPSGRPLKLSAPPVNDYGSDLVQNLIIESGKLMFWSTSCFYSSDQEVKKDHIDKLYNQMRQIKLKKEQLKREIDRIRSVQAQREKESYISIRQKLEKGGGMTCEKDFKTACERDLTKYEIAKKFEMVKDQVCSLGADLYQVVVRDKDGNLKRFKKPITGAELCTAELLRELKKVNLKRYEILLEPRSSEFTYRMSADVPEDDFERKLWDQKYGDKDVCMNVTDGGANCIYYRESKRSNNIQSDYICLNSFLSSPWDRKRSQWVGNTCNLPRDDFGEKYREPSILRGKKLVLPSDVDNLEEYVNREEVAYRFKKAAPEVQEEIRKKSQLFWAIYRCEIPEEILMDFIIKANRYKGTVTYERPDLGYKIVDKGDKISLAGETEDLEKQVRLMFEIALKKGWKLEFIRPLPESSDEFAEVLYKVKDELLKEQTDKMFTHKKKPVAEVNEGFEVKQPVWKERGLEKNSERYSNKNAVQTKIDSYDELISRESNKEFLATVKETLDPQLCVEYATVKYGIEKEKYEVKGKHIIYNKKRYNVVDFFSKHCQMRFQDVTPLLKEISKDRFVMPDPEEYGADFREELDRL